MLYECCVFLLHKRNFSNKNNEITQYEILNKSLSVILSMTIFVSFLFFPLAKTRIEREKEKERESTKGGKL